MASVPCQLFTLKFTTIRGPCKRIESEMEPSEANIDSPYHLIVYIYHPAARAIFCGRCVPWASSQSTGSDLLSHSENEHVKQYELYIYRTYLGKTKQQHNIPGPHTSNMFEYNTIQSAMAAEEESNFLHEPKNFVPTTSRLAKARSQQDHGPQVSVFLLYWA